MTDGIVEHKKRGYCPCCQKKAGITTILKLTYFPESKEVYWCHDCWYFFNENGQGNTI